MSDFPPIPTLQKEFCLKRQAGLRELMEEHQLEAVLIGDRHHVHYYSAYWERPFFSPLFLLTRTGESTLVIPFACEWEMVADQIINYDFNRVATMELDQQKKAFEKLNPLLKGMKRIGVDFGIRPGLLSNESLQCRDLTEPIQKVRRAKYPDEIDIFKRTFAATEVGYSYAREHLAPGISEVELYAGMEQAISLHLGEDIGFFGNDFRISEGGGLARRRRGESGELAVLDLGICCRGYRSDMCRTFAVDTVSNAQAEAREMVLEVIQFVEKNAAPGVSCKEMYEEAKSRLDGHKGWAFGHHLGHGLGLSPHEYPHLNPMWDETFELGDLFTVEPGLYHPELKGGLRIEQVYFLTEGGLEMITTFPTEY